MQFARNKRVAVQTVLNDINEDRRVLVQFLLAVTPFTYRAVSKQSQKKF
jgi:hypothetical protein